MQSGFPWRRHWITLGGRTSAATAPGQTGVALVAFAASEAPIALADILKLVRRSGVSGAQQRACSIQPTRLTAA